MNPAKRRTVIAGNWKMNFTPDEATAFINEIKPMVAGKDNCDIIFLWKRARSARLTRL